MIQALTLGKVTFPINLIQGPLAGVSCAPFRELAWKYSRPAFSCTEMISAKTLQQSSQMLPKRYIHKSSEEGPVCYQLSSNNCDELAEVTKKITDYGADLIDLNCGCPVKKIRQQGRGSRLLADPKQLFHLISAIKNNTHVPVSIKIRVDGESNDRYNEEIAQVISDSGLDFLIVHGRHWQDSYEVKCHYNQIKFFVSSLKIPVIGNGDVRDLDSLKKMFNTGCAGVMISRAGVGQPWLINELAAAWKNEYFAPPSVVDIKGMLLTHVEKLILLLNNEKAAIVQARKFAPYYARSLSRKIEFCQALNKCYSLKTFIQICDHYFQ